MRIRLFFYLIVAIIATGCSHKDNILLDSKEKPTIKAPFKKRLDKLSTNAWWKKKHNKIINLHLPREDVIAFGLYTVSNKTLKLSAQLFPLYPKESRTVRLEIKRNDQWQQIQEQSVNDIGWSALFRVKNWDNSKDIPYRLRHGKDAIFEGLVRKNPIDKNEIVVAALSCNSKKDDESRSQYVSNINHQNPDLVFFAGDQSYIHREHTAAWLKFGMQFRETFRNRPCIVTPDDHDVGELNLWGEGGKKAKGVFSFRGGYRLHPEYVKMVERCQTSHLPDPYDPTPVLQGIQVHYTNLILGGIDFAIIEDRKFKSGPKNKIKNLRPLRPDQIKRRPYDPASIDLEDLILLGERQLKFLRQWAQQKEGISMKAVLSQTGFASASHRHTRWERPAKGDLDSNGWPQTGRNKALRIIKEANAVHIAGDQHLGTVIQHGIDEFEDGPWAFVVPAIANDIYRRRWQPEKVSEIQVPDSPLPWTGRYEDGFGNKITMHAYANPDGPSKGSGYGLIRFNKSAKQVTFECWPRYTDVSSKDAKQFTGWPITISTE